MLDVLKSIPVIAWFYIGAGLAAIYFARMVWLTRREWARAGAFWDREDANLRASFAFIGLMVVLTLAVVVTFLTRGRSSSPPPIEAAPTGATDVVAVPTPTPTTGATFTPTVAPTPNPLPSPTLPAAPTPAPSPTEPIQNLPTPTPDLSPGRPPNCPHIGARITQPDDGAHVTGIVEVSGAANLDNFDYYKFEFRRPGGEWSYIQHSTLPVAEGALGQWNSDSVPSGEYEFRLVVVDVTGNYPEPCTIRLIVE